VGVRNAYEFWDLSGKQITGDSYTGNSFVIKIPGAHCGYDCTYPSVAIGAAMYTDLYYLLVAPESSRFTFSQGQHSSPLFKQQINISMSQGNFLSLCAMNDEKEAPFYLKGATGLMKTPTLHIASILRPIRWSQVSATTFNFLMEKRERPSWL